MLEIGGPPSVDRRRLERNGWRTTLDFRENLRREPGGRLLGVDAVWIAEAERRDDDGVHVVTVRADRAAAAWASLWRHVRRGAADEGFGAASGAADQGVRELLTSSPTKHAV